MEPPESLSDLERRTLEAFDRLESEDRQRTLMVVAAMRAGIEIDPADMQGKTPEELRLFADRLREQIAAHGSEH